MFNIQNQESAQYTLNQHAGKGRLGNHRDLLSGDAERRSPNQDLQHYGADGEGGEVRLRAVPNDDELQTPTRHSPGEGLHDAAQQVRSSEVMNSGSDTTGYFRHLSTLNDHQMGQSRHPNQPLSGTGLQEEPESAQLSGLQSDNAA